MATIVNGRDSVTAGIPARSAVGKIALIAIFVWAAAGPVTGITYEYFVNGHDWFDIANLSAADQDVAEAAYFANAATNFALGAVIWFAGLVGLGMAAWMTHPTEA